MSRAALVTGGLGFIGRQAIGPLLERGFEVHVPVAPFAPAVSTPDGVRTYPLDLMDKEAVRQLVREVQPSHLLHFAWETAHGLFWRSLANLDWVQSSLHLFRAFAEAGGKRIVGAGTCAEYFWCEDDLTEDTSREEPTSLYGVSKLSCGRLLKAFAKEAGIESAWGRVFFLYGPFEGKNKLIASCISTLLSGSEFLASEGKQIRDFLHVQDIGAAFAALTDSPLQETVNIASGKPNTIAQVLTTIAELIGVPHLLKLGARPTAEFDPPRIVASAVRLERDLGFVPHFNLEEGLADAIAWWRTQG